MSHRQIHLLIELGQRGGLGVGEAASLVRVDKSTASRALGELASRGLARKASPAEDGRRTVFSLTRKGERALARVEAEANEAVGAALACLREDEQSAVAVGLRLYAKGLERATRARELVVRPIDRRDDQQMADVIRTVMPEFGATGPGFAIEDPEVDAMSEAYRGRRARYYVVADGDRVVGGAGFAQLEGAEADVCELRKMYFLPEARGLGVGRELLRRLLDEAAKAGFRVMYLETLEPMHRARSLYRDLGFEPLEGPMGATGHFGCDRFYARHL